MAFDPDAHLDDSGFDPDAHLDSDTKPSDVKTDSQGRVIVPDQSYMTKYFGGIMNAARKLKGEFKKDPIEATLSVPRGAVETLVSPITHTLSDAAAVASNALPSAPAGSTFASERERFNQGFGNVTDPKTQTGKAMAETLGAVFKPVGDVLSVPGKVAGWASGLMGASPEAQQSVEGQTNAVTNAALLGYGARKADQPAKPKVVTQEDVQAALNKQQAGKSMGAASTAPDLSQASPELRAKVAADLKAGQTINPETLNRHIEAGSLPVPVPLTKGQAMQDVDVISQEMNSRGATKLSQVYKAQNDALVANIQELRDRVGPDVFSTNPIEHGDTIISAYKEKAATANADISAKYQALRDANGGQFPVDAPALLQNATEALHKDLLFDHAPKAVMNTLNRLAEANNMTFENFESLRTNLARIQRSMTADGNEKAAAGIIRDAMEQLPLAPQAANLKPLADQARVAARTQFQALEADPAYKAAVTDAVPADKFVHKYLVSAPRDAVAKMAENLADNDAAKQTLGVAIVDYLKSAAGIDRQGNGNFSQSMFNKNFEKLEPKLKYVFDPATSEIAEKIGNVARYTQVRPKGSYVNESNTLVGAIAEGAKSSAEGALNVAAKGIPIGTGIRRLAERGAAAKDLRKATEIGAGISEPTKLSTLMKPKK